MRNTGSIVILACVVIALKLSTSASGGTAGPSFSSAYSSDALSLTMTPGENGAYAGRITFKGNSYPFRASPSANGTLTGSFQSGSDSYPFSATLEGDVLIFKTGDTTYRLHSAPAAAAAAPANDFKEVAIRDSNPQTSGDAAHLSIPSTWHFRSNVVWGNSGLLPCKISSFACSPDASEVWIAYPAQCFVWRDNFDLFGFHVDRRPGDPDLQSGEELEPPLPTGMDCIRRVMVPRFRTDLANAKVVSSNEFTSDEAHDLAARLTPDTADSSDPQIHIAHRAAQVRVEDVENGKTFDEDLFCLAMFADLGGGNGAMHIWQITYATSFRAEKGHLDAEKKAIAEPIEKSIKIDPQWQNRAKQYSTQITENYKQQLIQLAHQREAQIINGLNRSIFDMAQHSYAQRQSQQAAQVHGWTQTLRGYSDYTTPSGKTIEAPMTHFGQSAWLGPDGQVHYFSAGTNPGPGYQLVKEAP